MKIYHYLTIVILIVFSLTSAQIINQDDFEGSGNINWQPLFYSNDSLKWEENLEVISNPFGTGNVGRVQDTDTSYTGASLVGGDVFNYQKIAIEADVYCYVNTASNTSRYTGVALMADTSINTSNEISTRYVKLVADFDNNSGLGARLRLYNSDLNVTTFQYSFDRKFYASNVPGGLPSSDGWHHFRMEARFLNTDSVEYTTYFDGNLVGGGPVYDYTYDTGSGMHYPYTEGTYGLFSFKQGDVLPGYFDNVIVEDISVTSIHPQADNLATGFKLSQNYPNPFNPTTQIGFELPSTEFVQLEIYNLIGQKVRTLLNEDRPAGVQQVTWDARDDAGRELPAGIYYYQLKNANFQQTRKMLLVK